HPCSNGEFAPQPATAVVLETARRTRDVAERRARQLGMTRRRFLQSSMGAATMLTILAACSREAERDAGSEPGGTFDVPPDAGTDPGAAREALGGDDFVFDVQGHFLEYSHDSTGDPPSFPQSGCGEDAPTDCYSVDKFLDLVLNKSDTSMIV